MGTVNLGMPCVNCQQTITADDRSERVVYPKEWNVEVSVRHVGRCPERLDPARHRPILDAATRGPHVWSAMPMRFPRGVEVSKAEGEREISW